MPQYVPAALGHILLLLPQSVNRHQFLLQALGVDNRSQERTDQYHIDAGIYIHAFVFL
jgi:hypothetical protein